MAFINELQFLSADKLLQYKRNKTHPDYYRKIINLGDVTIKPLHVSEPFHVGNLERKQQNHYRLHF